jgi:class 3 adenylate cyclase
VARGEIAYARTSDGVFLAYQVIGDGPVDVLISGSLWWNIEYQWTEPELAEGFRQWGRLGRVITFDKRGTGLSDRVPVDQLPDLHTRAEDLNAVLDAAGSTSALVMGFNHGTPLALLYAATYPERTRALVVSGGYARLLRSPEYPCGMPASTAQRVLEMMATSWDEPHALELIAPSRAGDPALRAWWATMQRMSASPSAAVALWSMAMDTDVRSVLSAISVPTLITHQAGDRLINPDCSLHLAENIEGAVVGELPGEDLPPFADQGPLVELVSEFLPDHALRVTPDRSLATIVFTDIVGSTETLASVGDASWRTVLDRHDALVERSVSRFGGRIVNTTGDGAVAIFDGPSRAVECAAAVVAGASSIGLRIRAGVHTGEVERRGDDISGLAVHLAARVGAFAGPDEVVVTRTVTDLAAGSGLVFDDLGEHELKGIEGRWQLHRLRRDGVR